MLRSTRPRRRRLPALLALLALAAAAIAAGLAQLPGAAAATPLSITVSGNHFVDGAGQTIRLLGVNHPSFEYACADGYAYNDGIFDEADAAAVASWRANAVRVPLNEDCWLGINGLPSNAQNPPPNPQLTAAGYRQEVERYVAELNAHGIYAILDLHWSAPGGEKADGQRPMPDEHSVAFWESVATTFRANPAVVFDLFNEPYSPRAIFGAGAPELSWSCWRNGGCDLPVSNDQTDPAGKPLYTAVGMQALVTAVRGTGATQPLLIGGLDYSNDLSQWLANAPKDPLGQEAASFHNYQGKTCDDAACWNSVLAPIAQVPLVTGEFAEEICSPVGFDEEYMTWADGHGVSYLGWAWWLLSPGEIAAKGCQAYYLIGDAAGTPASPNGVAIHDHLAKLPSSGSGPGTGAGATAGAAGAGQRAAKGVPIRLTGFGARARPGGAKVAFELRAAQSCSGTIAGQTAKPFAVASAGPKRHEVSLGRVGFALVANKVRAVTLKVSRPARKLLAAKGSLKARFTIALTSAAGERTVLHRTLTLRVPARQGR
jgi:endoglucanase